MPHAGLKYLFDVVYIDGETYEQNEDDVSVTDSSRSCFFDVDPDRVAIFTVRGQGRSFSVHLRDGHFEIDGAVIWLDDRDFDKYRLIYFRRMQASYTAGGESSDDRLDHVCTAIGWQANDADGKNVKRILYID